MVHESANPLAPLTDHLERLLDAALEQTFPASDPIAVNVPRRTQAVAPLPQKLQL
jgi:hypothetical protein